MRRLLALLIVALSVACSGNDTPRPDQRIDARQDLGHDLAKDAKPTLTTTPVGVAGGTATSADGKAQLQVVPGSLSTTQTITIEPAKGAPSGNLDVGYDIGPTGLVFDKLSTVSVGYDAAKAVGIESQLRLGTVIGGQWQPVLGSVVDTKQRLVIGQVAHLSTYGVIIGPCGNGALDSGEQCDGALLGGQSCTGLGYAGGALGCKIDCALDTTACTTSPSCGDGKIDAGEECDTKDFGGKSCTSLGFSAGTIKCTAGCLITGCTSPGYATIAAGSFTMGSPSTEPCRGSNETQHQVSLTRAFELATTEVTQGDFLQLMAYNPSSFTACGETCPVEMVTWYEAVATCNALSVKRGLSRCYTCTGTGANVVCSEAPAFAGAKIYDCPGYRLPTDAEWEYAYRAGTKTAYYNGDNDPAKCTTCSDATVDKIAWYQCNASKAPHAVQQKTANTWGVYDLAGNVTEWTNDRYQSDLGATSVVDPWGPATGTGRVVRGGDWQGTPQTLRAANRWYDSLPTFRASVVGFRCARSLL